MLKSKKIWGFFIAVFFLWLSMRNVSPEKIPAVVSTLRLQFVLLMVLSLTCEHLLRAIRWRTILAGRSVTIKHAWFATILGYCFTNLLPARAGEFVKAMYLKKKQAGTFSEIIGSIVVERFLDGVVLITMIAISLQYFRANEMLSQAAFSALVFNVLVLIFIVFTWFRRNWVEYILSKVFGLLPTSFGSKLNHWSKSFIDGLDLISKPLSFLSALASAYVGWFFSITTIVLCLKMFSLNMGYSEATLIVSILALAAMIPSSPGMIGIYQFCSVLALHNVLNQPLEVAATFGLVSHAMTYFYSIFAGFAVMAHEGVKYKELKKVSEIN